jgi:hypothetical protein
MPLRAGDAAPAGFDRVLWAVDGSEFPLASPSQIRLPEGFLARGEVHAMSAGDVLTVAGTNPFWLGMMHKKRCEGVYLTPSARGLPSWAQAAPMREMLHLAARDEQAAMMHAAVLGQRGCGVLLAGKGGSGKSTTSLIGLMHGLQFAGDDYVYCAHSSAGWCAHMLYDTAKVKDRSLQLFPELLARVERLSNDTEQKWVVFGQRHFPLQMAPALRLKAILLPRPGDGLGTTIAPARASDAVWALAPTTTAQMPFTGMEIMAMCRQMAEELPAFWLNLGHDAAGIVASLKSVLEA